MSLSPSSPLFAFKMKERQAITHGIKDVHPVILAQPRFLKGKQARGQFRQSLGIGCGDLMLSESTRLGKHLSYFRARKA
jgi:hypothetical protein